MKKILLTGGGSAGHVMPNIALVPDLQKNFDLTYMGTGGIEKGIVQRAGLPFYQIDCPKLVRGSIRENLTLPLRLFKSVRAAKKGLKIIRPDAVFSKGGYVSLPVAIAAKKLKIPVVSHESDLEAGLANKLIARYSEAVLTSFPETAERVKHGKYAGAPIRRELFTAERAQSLSKYGFDGTKPVLLIFGGGSGSAAINADVRRNLLALCRTYDLLHICGKGNQIQSNVKNYRQLDFEPDMGAAYAAADLVICRAGSNTLFEIIALRKRAVVIPLANKRSRGDQIQNAEYFRARGLITVFAEHDLSDDNAFRAALKSTLHSEILLHNLQTTPLTPGNPSICRELQTVVANSSI